MMISPNALDAVELDDLIDIQPRSMTLLPAPEGTDAVVVSITAEGITRSIVVARDQLAAGVAKVTGAPLAQPATPLSRRSRVAAALGRAVDTVVEVGEWALAVYLQTRQEPVTDEEWPVGGVVQVISDGYDWVERGEWLKLAAPPRGVVCPAYPGSAADWEGDVWLQHEDGRYGHVDALHITPAQEFAQQAPAAARMP